MGHPRPHFFELAGGPLRCPSVVLTAGPAQEQASHNLPGPSLQTLPPNGRSSGARSSPGAAEPCHHLWSSVPETWDDGTVDFI